jgi:hypothetical protein
MEGKMLQNIIIIVIATAAAICLAKCLTKSGCGDCKTCHKKNFHLKS